MPSFSFTSILHLAGNTLVSLFLYQPPQSQFKTMNSAICASLITALILSVSTGIGSMPASAQSLFPDQAEPVAQQSESFIN